MNDKELVAVHAAKLVKDGMRVGLGTGSTADCFIKELSRLHKDEGLKVIVIASSVVSAIKARELGLPLQSIEQTERIDLYVDGADEVTLDKTLLKGRGYDLVREKLLAKAADRFVVLIDKSKLVGRIGERFPIPIEVMPFAWRMVKESLVKLGGRPALRRTANGDGLVVTSYGSLVLDTVFDATIDTVDLDDALNAMPGVIEHGIFWGLASSVLIGADGAIQELDPETRSDSQDVDSRDFVDDGSADGD
ncbi:ribose-5-phosphate isomerase RpiA [Methylotuvimicrobium sp.]|uniref:ribose-5-phosphate isomerase RpiA n=1 Tax=Methylotuvimicrobium sp. TaxID=2822413 RepID=UPI003D650D76